MSDREVRIHFIGSPEKVGRAAYLIESKGKQLVLDYGVELTKPPKLPLSLVPQKIYGVILTHAHLDHVGAAPYLYVSGSMPLYTTKATLELTELLIKDFLKLSGEFLPFEYLDFTSMAQRAVFMDYDKPIKVPKTDFEIMFKYAGHIPGSAQVILYINRNGKYKILYTSDINTYETRLQNAANCDYDEEFDIVIIESTYGGDVHPNRRNLEIQFIETINETIENRGIALIPSFAIARSQEVLLILEQNNFKHTIVMDGMSLDATEILLKNESFLKDPITLRKAYEKVKKIRRWRERKKIIKNPSAIIAPSGMLGGGTAVFYISKLYKSAKNSILLVGYQPLGSPGRTLLEKGTLSLENIRLKVGASVHYFEFSSHTDKLGLKKILSSLSGDPLIVIVHGDERGRMGLKEIAEEMGFRTFLPRTNDVISV
ncbi:MAG: MBL fold metallo-hydrolase [Candidatus Geothermarchaeota archaeon]